MKKTPCSIIARQKRWTSRAHAFCSSGVPLRCCWAIAAVEADRESSASARKILRIVFFRCDGLQGRLAYQCGMHSHADVLEVGGEGETRSRRNGSGLQEALAI